MGIMSEKENQIIVYQPNETVRLDVRLENETVWLNQSRLGDLFGVDRTVINRHIHNIYKTGELDMDSTCAKIAQVQNEGGRSITRTIPFYNLDMIIAVGYRVNSLQATRFRQWATKVLRDYLLRGYSINARMSQIECLLPPGGFSLRSPAGWLCTTNPAAAAESGPQHRVPAHKALCRRENPQLPGTLSKSECPAAGAGFHKEWPGPPARPRLRLS